MKEVVSIVNEKNSNEEQIKKGLDTDGYVTVNTCVGYDSNDSSVPNNAIINKTKNKEKFKKLTRPTNRKMPTFMDRLGESSEELLEWYNNILEELEGYRFVKARISERYNTIRIKRTPLLRISLRKNSIRLYFNLEPNIFPKNFRLKDSREKTAFASYPALLTLNSNRAFQNALTMLDALVLKFNLYPKPNAI